MNNILGVDELIADLTKTNQEQQKQLNPIIKVAVHPILQLTRNSAPILHGFLRKGIILKNEKAPYIGKRVIDVTFDEKMNDIFQNKHKLGINNSKYRIKKNGSNNLGTDTMSYYPASMEYGFRTRNGGFVPGFHFMKKSIEANYIEASEYIGTSLLNIFDKTMIEKSKKVDKGWQQLMSMPIQGG